MTGKLPQTYVQSLESTGAKLDRESLNQIALMQQVFQDHSIYCQTQDPHAGVLDLPIELAVTASSMP